jgi:ribosomal protein S18 acetylase RimI-like enzyme
MPIDNEPCSLCGSQAEYSCSECGELICANDTRIRLKCTKCSSAGQREYTIHQAFCEDIEPLSALVTLFWGDSVQLMFDHHYKVTEQPAFIAESDNKIAGFIFYTPFQDDAVLIVALGVLPMYQGCGIGRDLVTRVEEFAKEQGRPRMLVVTTNDNLPALSFYQCVGFQLFEVIPDIIAEKLGGFQPGFAQIPIRDELRFRKYLS